MYSYKQKNKFALLRAEGASLNSIGKKLIDMRFSSIYSAALLKMKINIHNEIVKYEDKNYFFPSVKKSQRVAPNNIVTDFFDEYNPVNRIPVNLIKCHSFVIFLSVIFYYVTVLSIPKMSYVNLNSSESRIVNTKVTKIKTKSTKIIK